MLKQSGFSKTILFLPFPEIIVEDLAGCVIVSDTEERQRGFGGLRQVLAFRSTVQVMPGLRADILSTSYIKATMADRASVPDDATILHPPQTNDKTVWNAETPELNQHALTIMGDKAMDVPFLFARPAFVEDAFCAMDEIIYLNTPNRYIPPGAANNPNPEEPPAQWRRRVLRTNERARFILMTPGEIKAKYFPHEVPGAGSPKSPHYRRAHYRTLSSDFYKNRKGSTILIPASWIGTEEARIGNRHYRVLLDR